MVYRLYYVGTVEEVIEERLQRKRALAGAVIKATESPEQELADLLAALQRIPAEYAVSEE
jgi:SNF2 family DNA or RNA helicase